MKIRIADSADVSDMFRIRLSVNENSATVAELASYGVTPESLPAMLSNQGRGWIAEVDGVARAFAMADANNATIFALFVEPGFEGRSIGLGLMNQAEQWLAEMGCCEIWLETDSNTQVRSNGFYRHTGWSESGIQPDGQVKFIKKLPDPVKR